MGQRGLFASIGRSLSVAFCLGICHLAVFVLCHGHATSVHNATTLVGRPVLLTCHVPGNEVSKEVRWLRPRDNVVVSRNYNVTNERLRQRMRVVGDASSGYYNLLIKYARYPQDQGTWICQSQTSGRQETELIIIVPPSVSVPMVTPDDVSTVEFSNEAWTFTCAGHNAFPPVELRWTRLYGPEVDFLVTIPQVVTSREQTFSLSIKLILTWRNIGSRFICEARHPSFRDQVFKKRIDFTPTQDQQSSLGSGGLITPRSPSDQTGVATVASMGQLDSIDAVLVGIICAFLILLITTAVLLMLSRRRWEIDVYWSRPYHERPTSAAEEAMLPSNGTACQIKTTIGNKRVGRVCCIKIVVGTTFLVILLLSLSLAIPVYLKGVTIPSLGTDEITSVMAGSALWLDCTQQCQPIESLLYVTWSRNNDVIYHQQFVGGKNIGFPANSTLGFSVAWRVTSMSVCQMTIWPVSPGEDGVYYCSAYMTDSNHGRTVVRRKTTAVFVATGPVMNNALLVLLIIALIAAVGTACLATYHSLKCKDTSTLTCQ